MIFLLIIAAAAALLFWPEAGSKPTLSLPMPTVDVPAVPQPPKCPSFRSSIESLAAVRARILATNGSIDDDAKKAIDSLTLCLVAGSDKE